MQLSPVDRVYAKLTVTAKLADGSAATVTGVDIAALPARTDPDNSTTWTASTYGNGIATVLLAGPDADPTGAIPIPTAGADLWARITDSPEVQAVKVAFVYIN